MSIEKEIKEKEETINAILLEAAQSEEKHKKVLDILSKKPESIPSVKEAFQKIRDIYNDLNNKCAEYNLPSGKLFNNFDGLLDKIEEAINFPLFYHKNIIALCGQFSSGKTSMINSFLEENILPTDIVPTTAINTFVICDKDYENQGLDIINCFSGKTEKVDKELYKFITHAFAEKYNKDIHNMVKYVLLHTKKLKYENIALLDTPGYTGDEDDENIAMKGIAQADNIIWVIDIENGTIRNNDLKFLEKEELNGKDILIVLNKADYKSKEDIDKTVEEIKNQLEIIGIDYKDIAVYSSRFPEKYKEDKKKILDFFESENNSIEINYIKDINIIFEEFIKYYKKLYEDFSNNTKALNIAKAKSINSKTKADVKSIDITLDKIKKDRENIKKLIEELEKANKKCLDLLGDSLYSKNKKEYYIHKKEANEHVKFSLQWGQTKSGFEQILHYSSEASERLGDRIERQDELYSLEGDEFELEYAKSNVEDAKSNVEDAKLEVKSAEVELEYSEKILKKAEDILSDAESILEYAKSELENAKDEKLLDAKLEFENAKDEVENAKSELKDAEAEVKETKIRLEEAEKVLEEAEKELEEAKDRLSEAESSFKESTTTFNNNRSALIDEIKDVVAAQLNISDKSKISDTAYFVDDLNADSLDLVELIMELEKRYDIKIPQEDQYKIQSILDAARYIEEHTD